MSIPTPRLLSLVLFSPLLLSACHDNASTSQLDTPPHLFNEPRAFDLEAHRGGLGLVSESTLAAFANALEMGVTTLEMDTQITRDGIAVVTHDRKISDKKCLDTQPASEGDPLYPYVGKYIKDLTLAQVKTLDCGSLPLADFPEQVQVPGATMPTLQEVLALVNAYQADQVLLNIETKVEAGAPEETAPREIFVKTVLKEIRDAGLMRQATIQSFDWGSLMLARELEPSLPIIALTNGQQFLQVGMPGASPWLGGLDIDDFNGDLVQAVASFGADAISPVHGDPQGGRYGDPGYVEYTIPDLVDAAHAEGIKVIPWTVDDEGTMNRMLENGVDGMITDYPDRLRVVMEARGIPLPPPVSPR
jgi:glycerophosphoryl diester phosphodiesterase